MKQMSYAERRYWQEYCCRCDESPCNCEAADAANAADATDDGDDADDDTDNQDEGVLPQ